MSQNRSASLVGDWIGLRTGLDGAETGEKTLPVLRLEPRIFHAVA
jgi:hypothetical protein